MKLIAKHSRLAALLLTPVLLCAAEAIVGQATSAGSFRVNGATVPRSASLFDGAIVETSTFPCTIRLAGGGSLRLSPGASVVLHANRVELSRGMVQLQGDANSLVESLGFRIRAGAPRTSLRVYAESGDLRVELVRGSARVITGGGLTLAQLTAKGTLRFLRKPLGEAENQVVLTGCVREKQHHYFLTDDTTHVVVELTGKQVPPETGHRIEMNGSFEPVAPLAKATAPLEKDAVGVVQVAALKRLEKGCAWPAAAKYAMIGGVAITAATLAVTEGSGGDNGSVSVP